MAISVQICVSYFTANGMDFVATTNTPYSRNFVAAIRNLPSARYDPEDKSWCLPAEYGSDVEELVKRYFPKIPVDIQEHRKPKT